MTTLDLEVLVETLLEFKRNGVQIFTMKEPPLKIRIDSYTDLKASII